MPVAVTIRNVPEDVRNELASRAALKGRSLQQFLLQELIDLSHRPDREAVVAHLRSKIPAGQTIAAKEIVAATNIDRR